jgi:antitoxin HicB
MRTFAYRARLEPGDHHGVVVNFPDVPEAITEGRDEGEACVHAEEALGLALLTYPGRGLPLPRPRARGSDLVLISVEPSVAAKLALLEAIRAKRMSQRAFARLIGKDEKEARRILDPRHATKLATLTAALRKLGQRLVIAVEPEPRKHRPAEQRAGV